MDEGEVFEEKSAFDWSNGQQYAVAKTIVAFANTHGGRILIKRSNCDPKLLDSARLDDFVNKYVAPRIGGISSSENADGNWEIFVEKSLSAPHVFVEGANYKDRRGKQRAAWHPGQVYVRHSSKSEPATAEDFQRIIQENVGRWLGKLGNAMENLSLEVAEGKSSIPVQLSSEPSALKISVSDPNTDYPYSTKDLGYLIKRNQNWTAKALDVLGLKGKPAYSFNLTDSRGRIVHRRYNDRALEELQKILRAQPDFDPYH